MPQRNPDEKGVLEEATREVIKQAAKDGTLNDLTPRLVRKEVEKRLNLPSGQVDEEKYKARVKATTAIVMKEIEEAEEGSDVADPQPVKKRKPAGTDDAKAPRRQTKPKVASAAKAKKANEKASVKEIKSKRSASIVPSSDEEAAADDASPPNKPEASSAPMTMKSKKVDISDQESDEPTEPPKKRQRKSDSPEDGRGGSFAADSTGNTSNPQSKAIRAKSTSPVAPLSGANSTDIKRTTEGDASGDKSESEMSVLIDEPPKKGRKKKGKTEAETQTKRKKEPKEKKSKPPAKELSKDEETIKRLKSLVVACGVRKVWAKEFKDLDRPSEQIKRLKEILSGLGMTGRMSLEQAKAIREKRELAQELEDVQKFAKALESGPASTRTRKETKPLKESSNEESDEDTAQAPKRRGTARQSIMAFLGDQSDED